MRLLARGAALTLPLVLLLTGSALGFSYTVVIRNFAFAPTPLTVNAGDSVTWTNLDSTAHRVHWTNAQFPDSKDLQLSEAYSVTFTAVGSYSYICGIHPAMQGVINVQRAAATTPAPPPPSRTPTPPPPTATPTPTPSPSPSPTPTETPTPSPTPSATTSATISPSPSVTATATASPLAAPAVQTNTFIGVALIAVGMSILIGALWWRFGRT